MRDCIFIKQSLCLVGILAILCGQAPLAAPEEPRILLDEEILNETPVIIQHNQTTETVQEWRGNDGTAVVKVKSLWGSYCLYFDANRPRYRLDEDVAVATSCR